MKRIFPSIAAWKVRLVGYGGFLVCLAGLVAYCTVMPGHSAESSETGSPHAANALRRDVQALVALGPRNLGHPEGYQAARAYLAQRLGTASGLSVQREKVVAPEGIAWNLFVEWGSPDEEPLVVVGAHYDTASETPGGNDNGSGVAVLLQLAERFRERGPKGALRLVLFSNEEPPYFWSEEMGSLVHARGCKMRKENVVAMLSLETMGHFSSAPNSQSYPAPFGLFYPSKGNFIALVGDLRSRALVAESVGVFRETVRFPSEGGSLPGGLPGVGWSDHWSFWQEDYPALMVTDTAPFRDGHYHEESDRGQQIDFGKLAVLTKGVEGVVRHLTGST